MGIINFPGPLPVALAFVWKGENITDAVTKSKANDRYVLVNESVFEFTVTGTIGAKSTTILHRATPKNRFFDDKLNMYTTSPVLGADLEQLVDPASGAKFRVDLTFSYHTFFDVLLQQMTRSDADLHNLANPNDSKAILDTFIHKASGKSVNITYKSTTQQVQAMPCTLADKEIKPGKPGKPPAVKLLFEIDFLTGIDAVRREAMRKLIAMDWSKLARFGKPAQPLPAFVNVFNNNVLVYLANNTNIKRGEKLRAAIVARHTGKSPSQLATDLRDDIDLHLVTANHWGQLREDMKTEHHQRLLSDLFGTLHQQVWLASPVHFNRVLTRDLGLTIDQTAALTLQYGTGHCGEHATTSFSVMRNIISAAGSQVSNAVLSGNANIDHAFVVYNLTVKKSILTTATSKANTAVLVGDKIEVWNLREAIAQNVSHGFVMDPYLDKTVMKPTAEELLTALNSKKHQAEGKDTDFLAFRGEFPVPAGFVQDDIRVKSLSERKKLVKNV